MDQVIEHITGLTNLESFRVSSHAAPSRMALLTSLPHLRHLDVDTWGDEEPDLSWLPRLHLTSLEAPFSEHIAGIGSLQELTVSGAASSFPRTTCSPSISDTSHSWRLD